MKLSYNGLALIKEFEGYIKKLPNGDCEAYRCPAGVWTIGWGCTEGVRPGMVWTRAKAEKELKKEINQFEVGVERAVTVPLTQNQFDALVSFSYNCGLGALKKSTILRKLNSNDYAGAAKAFSLYNKGGGRVLKGLVRRRKAEMELFNRKTDKEVVSGSRKLTWLRRLRNAIVTVFTSVFTLDYLGVAQEWLKFAKDNALWFLIGGAVAAWVVFKIVEEMSKDDYKKGNYVPSKLTEKEEEEVNADVTV